MKDETKNSDILLSVQNLQVDYSSNGQTVRAVNGVSFDLNNGQSLGLVGETGAGKTTIAKAILQILPDHSTKRAEGTITFKGKSLMEIKEHELQNIRGSQISMVFQDPMTALNPVMTVGEQIAEGIRHHQGLDKAKAKQEAIKMLETVGISRDRIDEYPHQFSGGMKQRVVIAIALACNPELLIADEPTTALDVTIQAQVLDLIKDLREKKGTSLILITHDLGVVADTCDKVAVVYAGEIVEIGALEEVFDHPNHPYTRGLFGAIPDMYKDVARLSPIEGLPPNPTDLPEGCYFAARCPHATDECRAKHCQLEHMSGTHFVRCLKKEQEG
jgi:peptide/nickel transport system ATP-binding protein